MTPGDPAPERDAAAMKARGGFGAHLVAAGIFLSRISGLLREAVFSRYFGTSAAADASSRPVNGSSSLSRSEPSGPTTRTMGKPCFFATQQTRPSGRATATTAICGRFR